MVKNYLTTALRSILKSRSFAIVNVSGLALGLAAFLLIMFYVDFELSYDKFHKNSSDIYRVSLDQYQSNELILASAENYPGVGPALLSEIPEVKRYTRLYNMGYKNNIVITYEDAPEGPIQFKHRKFLYADSTFLGMFGYQMVKGDPEQALREPFSAVISEEYAKKYFGDDEPIGKMIRLRDDDNNNELAKVTGVFAKLPLNTHLKFDVLFSYSTLFSRGEWAPGRYDESWQRKDMYTYIEVEPGTDPSSIEAKFPSIVNKYSPDLADRNRKDVLALQPLESIHLYSNLAEEVEPNGKASTVYTLALVSLFILVIAWVNYINLSTAKAMERANEVGVRKAMGAFKHQLIGQFLMESAIINIVSILLALMIIGVVLPWFNLLSGIGLTFLDMFSIQSAILIVGLWIVGTLLSGLYPAFVLSSFKPVAVLKGKLWKTNRGALLRKGLVIFQFVTSVALISGTLIVYDQLQFMLSRDIGMNIDQVLVVERPGVTPNDRESFNSNVDVFRAEIMERPQVEAFATSLTIPGKKREYKVGVKKYGEGEDKLVTLRANSMDFNFTKVFDMKTLAGRVFSRDFPNDPDTSVVITQASAKLLGFENPEDAIGQTLDIPAFRWSPIIIGVVNDYHQEALQKTIDPIIFYCSYYGGEFYSIRVSKDQIQETIEHVKESWNKAFAGNPFEYFFLDDYFNRQYENDRKFGRLFLAFGTIAIILGCLGLFGLSAFTVRQKNKEIGIRKVLGSSVESIFLLISKDFMSLILIACFIAVPFTFYFMNKWLNTFAYRIDISVWVFVFAIFGVLATAFITVSFQTVKAALINPVDSIRSE